MNKVEPIRDAALLDMMKKYLYNWQPKYGMLWTIGTNTGLRVSDILELKVSDLDGEDHIIIREEKTKKMRRIYLNKQLKMSIYNYIKQENLKTDDYLFGSQKLKHSPITRTRAYTVINQAARACGCHDTVGTHTMRKTFGYWHYQRYHDVALLQQIFNHSSPSITLRYIGINDDLIDKSLNDFFL